MVDPKKDITPQELEAMERLLTDLQPEISPSPEFTARMQKRLERHYVLMQERSDISDEQPLKRGLFSFVGTHVYSVITAFTFVIFTSGLSTFAYTSESVTNGTALYPIKRGIESLESNFVSTPESRAEYHMKLLTRRLAESRFLTVRGVVDEATNQEVGFAVDGGIQAIQAVDQIDYRDQLLDRISTILQEEEKKFYDAAGVPVPDDEDTTPLSDSTSSSRENIAPSSEEITNASSAKMRSLETSRSSVDPTLPIQSINSRIEIAPDAPESLRTSTSPISRDATESRTTEPQDDNQPLPVRETATSQTPPSPSTTTTAMRKGNNVRENRENIAFPLHVKPGVIEALERNSQHFKRIEMRVYQARRTR